MTFWELLANRRELSASLNDSPLCPPTSVTEGYLVRDLASSSVNSSLASPKISNPDNLRCTEDLAMACVMLSMTVKEFQKISRLGFFIIVAFFFTLVRCASEMTTEGVLINKMRLTHRMRVPRTADGTGTVKYPYFDNATAKNITTSSGKTTYLPCRVRYLGDRAIFNGSFPVSNFQVSWIRRKDLHVLTVGKFSYTNDQRFQVIHMDGSDDWTLQMKYAQRSDAGVYECQVSTVPKMSHFVTLNVIVSKATIVGRPALYINSGSTLNLTCIVSEAAVPPDYVFWYHNGKVINYDEPRGIRVETTKIPQTTSRLIIHQTNMADSGNYSCLPANANPAYIAVHVLNGQHPAAISGKHTDSSSTVLFPNRVSTLLVAVLLAVFGKKARFR